MTDRRISHNECPSSGLPWRYIKLMNRRHKEVVVAGDGKFLVYFGHIGKNMPKKPKKLEIYNFHDTFPSRHKTQTVSHCREYAYDFENDSSQYIYTCMYFQTTITNIDVFVKVLLYFACDFCYWMYKVIITEILVNFKWDYLTNLHCISKIQPIYMDENVCGKFFLHRIASV